jgi:hypothetical protein
MIRIFVEGRDDLFIKTYLKHLITKGLITEKEFDVIRVGGFTKLANTKNQFTENTDAGGINLLIFDADTVEKEGGYSTRIEYLQNQKSSLNITSHDFLFPNDNEDGDFETLLGMIINEKHRGLWECFTSYENCVSQYKDESDSYIYKLPIRKSRIYAYVDAFPKSNKKKEKFKKGELFFSDSEYWNLDSEYLKPLKEFLTQYFQ